MNCISFSDNFTNSNVHQKDLQNLISTIISTIDTVSANIRNLHVVSYKETPHKVANLMTTIEIEIQTWTGVQIEDGGTGTHLLWVCYRAKDFSCSNISVKKL